MLWFCSNPEEHIGDSKAEIEQRGWKFIPSFIIGIQLILVKGAEELESVP